MVCLVTAPGVWAWMTHVVLLRRTPSHTKWLTSKLWNVLVNLQRGDAHAHSGRFCFLSVFHLHRTVSLSWLWSVSVPPSVSVQLYLFCVCLFLSLLCLHRVCVCPCLSLCVMSVFVTVCICAIFVSVFLYWHTSEPASVSSPSSLHRF